MTTRLTDVPDEIFQAQYEDGRIVHVSEFGLISVSEDLFTGDEITSSSRSVYLLETGQEVQPLLEDGLFIDADNLKLRRLS